MPRQYLLASLIACVGLIAVVMFLSLGRILHEEDPLEHADVIFGLLEAQKLFAYWIGAAD